MTSSSRGDLHFGTTLRVLAHAASQWPDHPAIEDTATGPGGRTLSFAELAAEVSRCAEALHALGIEPGDRVAIWAPNMWEWVVAALGIHRVGGVLVPLNTRYKGPEAAWILERSGAKAVFTVDGFLGLDFRAMLGNFAGPAITFRDDFEAFLSAGSAEQAALPEVRPEDPSDMLFTSGTTGRPKGVLTNHAQTTRAYWDWSEVVGLDHRDRYLVVAPFFHCFGYKAGWLAAMMRGATVLPQPVFDAGAVLARIGPDRVSMLPGPPALYESLLQHADLGEHDLSSLRLAVTGAAVIPTALIERMRTELGFETVITGYGLTEATGIATMCRHDDDVETIARTSGRAIPGVEVCVVDTEGHALPAGEPGEVLVRGYNVMQGYWEDPEATAEAVSPAGWLHTGDVGVMDARGYLRITDRIKDMFIVGGFNAYPAEIEHGLCEHPGVAEAAVVGVPDARLGEVGLAFVVRRSGSAGTELDEAGLVAWARERMANFKVPRRVVFTEALPRNASAKVLRYQLREQARALEEEAEA